MQVIQIDNDLLQELKNGQNRAKLMEAGKKAMPYVKKAMPYVKKGVKFAGRNREALGGIGGKLMHKDFKGATGGALHLMQHHKLMDLEEIDLEELKDGKNRAKFKSGMKSAGKKMKDAGKKAMPYVKKGVKFGMKNHRALGEIGSRGVSGDWKGVVKGGFDLMANHKLQLVVLDELNDEELMELKDGKNRAKFKSGMKSAGKKVKSAGKKAMPYVKKGAKFVGKNHRAIGEIGSSGMSGDWRGVVKGGFGLLANHKLQLIDLDELNDEELMELKDGKNRAKFAKGMKSAGKKVKSAGKKAMPYVKKGAKFVGKNHRALGDIGGKAMSGDWKGVAQGGFDLAANHKNMIVLI